MLRDNGKQSAISPIYREYEPYGSTLNGIVKKWVSIGISLIAATSACFQGKKPSNRSEVDAITLLHQLVEMVTAPDELNIGAKKFVEKVRRVHQDLHAVCCQGQPQSTGILHIGMHQQFG